MCGKMGQHVQATLWKMTCHKVWQKIHSTHVIMLSAGWSLC